MQHLEGGTLETLHAILQHTIKDLNGPVPRWIIDGRMSVLDTM